MANTRIKNIANIETDIGPLNFVVPAAVLGELERLAGGKKRLSAGHALEYARGMPRMPISGKHADDAILGHVRSNGGIVATMDSGLKARVKKSGGSVLSVSNDRIVLEQQKL
ncbi:hypothetical protein CENSYa_1936 [Cenarchaeum symbiosum A]|uniref:VapC9 PIN-like domain-containing protein n=1 Tax=Cenarchaeum symbiosum (strain A) TaxID=414004 RepID=A0RYX7_CENSY|nr:hypothetical protein CENSYa_1936 [Cenarchaeum symbiosum A]